MHLDDQNHAFLHVDCLQKIIFLKLTTKNHARFVLQNGKFVF